MALLAARESELVAMEFEELMGCFRKLPEAVDVEATLKVADGLRLADAHVQKLEAEFAAEEAAAS